MTQFNGYPEEVILNVTIIQILTTISASGADSTTSAPTT
jgi:hypothetical protein